MQGIFVSLDDMLIERLFQPISDLLSYRVGLGRARAACLCLDAASVGWILARSRGLSSAVVRWDASASFFRIIVLLIGLLALVSLRALFRRAEQTRSANPLRVSMLPHRAIILVMLMAWAVRSSVAARGVIGSTDMGELAMLVFAAAALYLGACSERPPVRRGWWVMAGAS